MRTAKKQVRQIDSEEIRRQTAMAARKAAREEIRKIWGRVLMILGGVALLLIFLLKVLLDRVGAVADNGEKAEPILGISMEAMTESAIEHGKAFLEATTVEEMAKHVMEPERVLPLMRDYYERHPATPSGLKEFIEPKYHVAKGREFVMGTAVLENFKGDFWIFERDKSRGGEMFLQWEVVVGYSEVDWETFLDTHPTEPQQFRILLESGDYYNFGFSDSVRYLCFTARVPHTDRFLWAYLDQESQAFIDFAAVRMVSNLASLPVIATLKFPDPVGEGNQVSIESIESFSWVKGVDM